MSKDTKFIDVSEEQEIVKKIVDDIANKIIANKDIKDFCHVGSFNTQNLPNKYKVDGTANHPNIDDVFREEIKIYNELDQIKNDDCLYWFEADSIEDAQKFKVALDKYRSQKNTLEGYKTVPATNSYGANTKVIYVGVRRSGCTKKGLTNITGRINQHLGYYHHPKTQGLQLFEYARDKNFVITLKVVVLKGLDKRAKLLNSIERKVAESFKPLCGRH